MWIIIQFCLQVKSIKSVYPPSVTLYVSSVTLAQFSMSQISWGANPLKAAS